MESFCNEDNPFRFNGFIMKFHVALSYMVTATLAFPKPEDDCPEQPVAVGLRALKPLFVSNYDELSARTHIRV